MGKGRGSKGRRRAPRHRRLAVAIGVVLLHTMAAPAATAAAARAPAPAPLVTANPWQSWSYDGFSAMDRTLADPSALYADGQAVAYGTTARYCVVSTCATYWVPRFTSTSMAATAGLQSDALPARPAWVSPTDRAIWAPAVAEIGAFHVMYFSATAGPGAVNAGLKCIGVAVAETAAGPFMALDTALACGPAGYWAIDPYVVADGADLFLLWREDDPTHYLGKIVSAQLAPDGVSFAGAPERTLLVGEYPWEDGSLTALAADEAAGRDGDGGQPDGFDRRLPPGAADRLAEGAAAIGPIENPAMARHPATGEWLLTWSANSWNTQSYATGLAICASPLGPCERVSSEQPWLRTSGDGSIVTTASFGGTGGLSFALGPDTFLYAVFHAYRGTGDHSNSTRIGWIYQVVHAADGYRFAEFGDAPLMTMSPAD